jgi:uncharacterized protein RhaS with RHS repeats
MYYYKDRIYSPQLGRFLQVEPIGYDDHVNLYAYVGNDPVNARDPSGKCKKRDSASECIVENKAGEAGNEATARLQGIVRRVDHSIRDLDPRKKVTLEAGDGKTVTMSGKKLQKLWGRTT